MKLSVIIPCYNAADTIVDQLEAFSNQKWSGSWEIIVVNNRSTDDTAKVVNTYGQRLPNLPVIDASERQGQDSRTTEGSACGIESGRNFGNGRYPSRGWD